LVIKSTVPVGTNRALSERLTARLGRTAEVASNPEFLKEGAALEDFMKPDRVVVGVRRPEVAELLQELYAPFLRTERPFLSMSPSSKVPLLLLEAVDRVNEAQKRVLFQKIRKHFGADLKNQTLAIWGLAFKPRTDDIREAPALVLIDQLLAEGVKLRVHDPEALANVRAIYGDRMVFSDRPYGALEGADGLAIVTEWQEFRHPDFDLMRR